MNTSVIKAIVFDWAGTTVDFGSCAPILAFQRLFLDQGVEIEEIGRASCRERV